MRFSERSTMATALVPFRSALVSVWDDLESELARAVGDLGKVGSGIGAATYRPNMNLVETETEFVITLDLPGISLDETSIELKSDELLISGKRQNASESTNGRWHNVECSHGKFFRSVRLGSNPIGDHIDAEYRDGVLTIRIPRAADARPRKIDIRSHSQ